jgi:predicted nucleotidyltransferase
MQRFVEQQLSEIAELCRRFHVRRLDLFGSAAADDFDPERSDVDLLVEFEPEAPGRALERYFGFKEALEALFDRPVDLVTRASVKNPYLRRSIEEFHETLFAA